MLLNHRRSDQISRYECGKRTPTLRTAIQLEITYGVPCRLLFPDLYERLESQIRSRAAKTSTLSSQVSDRLRQAKSDELVCAYRELLRVKPHSEEHARQVRTHVVQLTRTLADI